MTATVSQNRPTVLLAGDGEAMDEALQLALDRHGFDVVRAQGALAGAARAAAADVVFLIGEAAADGGKRALAELAADPLTQATPTIVLGPPEELDGRLDAYRNGAVAVIPRVPSADAVAAKVAERVRSLGAPTGSSDAELGEATLDELVKLVGTELRAGILSVARRGVKDSGQFRIVLGAGRPVADVVDEFVKKLRPLVSGVEPLAYQLHQGPGGAVGLFDVDERDAVEAKSLAAFDKLRMLVVDTDPARADALAEALRAHGATVAVSDIHGSGLDRARSLDPQVVLLDAAGMDLESFNVVHAIRQDVRFRWASLLVVPWNELWPAPASAPDLLRLAARLAPLTVPDALMRERASRELVFEVRLEASGPSRLLRAVGSVAGPFHLTVRHPNATVEIDVAEGLLVGALAFRNDGDPLEGLSAVALLLALPLGRAHVEKRTNPSVANVMLPLDEALARAADEAVASYARGPGSSDPREVRKRVSDESADQSGPHRNPFAAATQATPPQGAGESDLRWSEPGIEDGAPTGPLHDPTKPWVALPPGVAQHSAEAEARSSKLPPSPKASTSAFVGSSSGGIPAAPKLPAVPRAPRVPEGTKPYGQRAAMVAPPVRPPAGALGGDSQPTSAAGAAPSADRVREALGQRSRAAREVMTAGIREPAATERQVQPLPAKATGPRPQEPPAPKTRDAMLTPPAGLAATLPNEPKRPGARASTVRRGTLMMGSGLQPQDHTGPELNAPTQRPPSISGDTETRPAIELPDEATAHTSNTAPAPKRPEPTKSVATFSASDARPEPRRVAPSPTPKEASSDPLADLESTFAAALTELERREAERPTPTTPIVDDVDAKELRPTPVEPSAAAADVRVTSAVDVRPKGEPVRPATPPKLDPADLPRSTEVVLDDGLDALAPGSDAFDIGNAETLAPGAPRPGSTPIEAAPAPAALAAAAIPKEARVPSDVGSPAEPAPWLDAAAPLPPPVSIDLDDDPPTLPMRDRTLAPRIVAGAAAAVLTLFAAYGYQLWSAHAGQGTAEGIHGEPGTAPETTPTGTAPEATPTPEVTPTPEATPEVTPTPEPTPEVAPTPEPTPEVTPTPEPTPEVAPTPEPTPEVTPTPAAEPVPSPAGLEGLDADQLVSRAGRASDAEAEPMYRRALELDGRNHYAMAGLASIYLRRNQPAQALPLAENAVRRRPRRAEFRILVGDVRRAMGDSAAANAAYREALEVEPDSREARARLAE